MKIAIICPSEIAVRRFLPALSTLSDFEFAGIAVANADERYAISPVEKEKQLENDLAKAFQIKKKYGGKVFRGYQALVSSNDVEALYIPLPPALHFVWAKTALLHGKHVLLEKPSTLVLKDTEELVSIARRNKLVIYENYMFAYHEQLSHIDELINSGELGHIRLFRITFGFPKREKNDFRYSKKLGGGALFDVGGYTIKYASILLGGAARIRCANLNYCDEFEVDISGSATIVNDKGLIAQIAFGMDNQYKCELEVWGSKGYLKSNRIFTAPSEFTPVAVVEKGCEIKEIKLPKDDTFRKSILKFKLCIEEREERENAYADMISQMEKIEEFRSNL